MHASQSGCAGVDQRVYASIRPAHFEALSKLRVWQSALPGNLNFCSKIDARPVLVFTIQSMVSIHKNLPKTHLIWHFRVSWFGKNKPGTTNCAFLLVFVRFSRHGAGRALFQQVCSCIGFWQSKWQERCALPMYWFLQHEMGVKHWASNESEKNRSKKSFWKIKI